jgi:hypothetical protein
VLFFKASTDGLNLEAVGLSRNPRGLLTVNKNYQTDMAHMCVLRPSWSQTVNCPTDMAHCPCNSQLRGWRLHRRAGAGVHEHGARPTGRMSHVG